MGFEPFKYKSVVNFKCKSSIGFSEPESPNETTSDGTIPLILESGKRENPTKLPSPFEGFAPLAYKALNPNDELNGSK